MTIAEIDQLNADIELLVFGDDLTVKTNLHLANAVSRWHQDQDASPPRLLDEQMLVWTRRVKGGYANSLEKFVAAYRRRPRDFYRLWEMMGLLIQAMQDKGFEFDANEDMLGKTCVTFTRRHEESQPIVGEGLDFKGNLPAAVALAAVAAMKGRKT